MSTNPLIDRYLRKLDAELKDLDRSRRTKMVSEIEEHILERLADTGGGSKKDDTREVQKVLSDFGTPEEVALNYRMQTIHEKNVCSSRPLRLVIPVILVSFLLIATASVSIFLLTRDDEDQEQKDHDPTIIRGEGTEFIGLGDTEEDILETLGEPREREVTEGFLWMSYRKILGVDFLLSTKTGEITEIRFNTGYPGKLPNGIGVGESLTELFEKEGGPRKEREVLSSYLKHQPVHDEVLFHIYYEHEHIADRYDDGKDGIMYWAAPNGTITQIVVFEPVTEDFIESVSIRASLDAGKDRLMIEALSHNMNWDDYEVRVDGKVLFTDSDRSLVGEVTTFKDPDGEWDPEVGEEYNIKVILVDEEKLVYEYDIIATIL